MTRTQPLSGRNASNPRGALIGLSAIAASTIAVEITITKFLAYKVHHHATYAVISMVVLAMGASGLFVYLRPRSWRDVSRAAASYAIGIGLATLLFCWMPIDPANPDIPSWLAGASVPIYLLLFSLPMFFAGVCISHTLAHASQPVTTIYFWDLIAAALGALVCPWLLSHLGGYGTVAAAGALGMVACEAFARVESSHPRLSGGRWILFAATTCALVMYPDWAARRWGFDVRSHKDLMHREVFEKDFGGIESTYWNGVARIDVSRTGHSNSVMYRFGLPPSSYTRDIPGRYILVDGGANTRQFVATGPIADQTYLAGALWASPYVAHGPARRALILGAGGGVDILVAKHFATRTVHVVELNPATVDLLTGKADDPDGKRYLPWLGSDARSKVIIGNQEGRHFCTTRPSDHYDLIQASGVDTLTAITTGGNSLVENYLYTQEAVEQYLRVLRPGGVLSLTHWRSSPPKWGLRMFLTFFGALERAGVNEPQKHLIVIGDSVWTDTLLKKTPFEPEEIDRIRRWANKHGHSLIYDPQRAVEEVKVDASLLAGEAFYTLIANASAERRAAIVDAFPFDVTPVSDDRPYFYRIERAEGWLDRAFPDASTRWLFLLACISALALVGIPLRRIKQRGITRNIIGHAAFFALCGFAFLLFEAAIIQMLSVFVGGPAYSLAVVLVSVLGGYALGSRLSARFTPRPRTYAMFGAILCALFLVTLVALPWVLRRAAPWPFEARIVVAVIVTLIPSIVVGMPVPLAMSHLRQQHGDVVAWMWGISSAFNVLGGMSFVPVSQLWGISGATVVVAVTYLIANVGLAWLTRQSAPST